MAGVGPDDVYLGNGVSELIVMALQALLDPGDEVLVPSPDYPLWTGAVNLCGARAVHYRCDEQAGWAPDLDDIAAKITPQTRALVIINPNNPTGAVYSTGDPARACSTWPGGTACWCWPTRSTTRSSTTTRYTRVAPRRSRPICVLTLCGLSKTYRAPGFRSGWLVVSGPRRDAAGYLEGLELLANMRMCPNVPAQFAIQTALGGLQSITALLQPGGRLREQRDSCLAAAERDPRRGLRQAAGALYVFPRLDPDVYKISTTSSWSSTCWSSSTCCSPTAPVSTWTHLTTFAGVPGRGGCAGRRDRPGHLPGQLPAVARVSPATLLRGHWP